MKAVLALIGVGILIAMMGGIMTSLQGATTASRTDTFATANVSTATVTLQESPWQALTSSVTLIASNVTTDHPIAASVANKQVSITGLDATVASHGLSVTYLYDSMTGYTGGSTFPNLTPLMLWVGIILIIIGIAVMIFQQRRGG
jgi:hypothetical protein